MFIYQGFSLYGMYSITNLFVTVFFTDKVCGGGVQTAVYLLCSTLLNCFRKCEPNVIAQIYVDFIVMCNIQVIYWNFLALLVILANKYCTPCNNLI